MQAAIIRSQARGVSVTSVQWWSFAKVNYQEISFC